MTVRVAIVEDEAPARARLAELLAEVSWVETVGEASDGEQAVHLIDGTRPDLVLLDIEMPGQNGFAVLEELEHAPAIIVTTAHDRFAVSAFELQAVDYLLKPFVRDRFFAAMERARKVVHARDGPTAVQRVRDALHGEEKLSRLFVRDRGRITPIAVGDIERLEAQEDYVAVHAGGRQFLVYLRLSEFERRLDASHFLRVHRTHIVNLDFVRHFEPYDAKRLVVVMRSGTRIIVSRVRSRELRHLAI